MSQENVEIVRAIYAEWERGNVEAALPVFDPAITFETFMPDASENVLLHGLDEIASSACCAGAAAPSGSPSCSARQRQRASCPRPSRPCLLHPVPRLQRPPLVEADRALA